MTALSYSSFYFKFLILFILFSPICLLAQKKEVNNNSTEINAVKLFESGRYQEALKLFEEGIAKNKKVSLFYIGKSFDEGRGVKPDPRVALEFYLKAAKLGHADAKARAGIYYVTGRSTLQDFKKGISLLKEASALGSKEASLALGGLYQQGYGVPKDLAESRRYFLISSDRNSPEASYALAKSYENGEASSGDPTGDSALAFKYMKKSADLDFLPALFSLAEYYEKGVGTSPDKVKAHIYYNLASASGSKEANRKMDELTRSMPIDDVLIAQTKAAEISKKKEISN